MKKMIIILFFISCLCLFFKEDDEIIIPDQAIRFRVIANSNSLEDQTKKMLLKSK